MAPKKLHFVLLHTLSAHSTIVDCTSVEPGSYWPYMINNNNNNYHKVNRLPKNREGGEREVENESTPTILTEDGSASNRKKRGSRSIHLRACLGSGKMQMCGFADVQIFKVVKCGEILQICLRMLWAKCGCGNAEMPQMSICLLPTFIALLL